TGPDTTACPGILSIPFSTDLPVVGVTVHTAKVGWEEIDAVAVINSAPPATAQTLTCTVEHITGDQCQGPDIEGQASAAFWEALGFQEPPGDNFCSVGVWVQKATCEVSVPGGVTTNAG